MQPESGRLAMATAPFTPKQRMLNAYRGLFSDRVAVAPEFVSLYPARLLGLDMIDYQERPRHLLLKQAFEAFGCEGWSAVGAEPQAEDISHEQCRTDLPDGAVMLASTVHTPYGPLRTVQQYDRHVPSWRIESPIKDPDRDLPAWEHANLADPESMDVTASVQAWQDVGESYLLEARLGLPFFDTYATDRDGGLAAAVMDFQDREPLLARLQHRYIDHIVRKARVLCERTPFESFFMGCSWSCNTIIGPQMWRRWDKPVIAAAAREVHSHGRLLHIHFHGRCMETLPDFAEMGIDCVCPFERPPGGDIDGQAGLDAVAAALGGRVTFNGNVHTVQTLIRGTPDDVCREVRQIMSAFAGQPRLIVGTGDQVGAETPQQNLRAMIDEAAALSGAWKQAGLVQPGT